RAANTHGHESDSHWRQDMSQVTAERQLADEWLPDIQQVIVSTAGVLAARRRRARHCHTAPSLSRDPASTVTLPPDTPPAAWPPAPRRGRSRWGASALSRHPPPLFARIHLVPRRDHLVAHHLAGLRYQLLGA